ncbi:MAG: lysine--tRNA ligase, partial [Natrinema limicola]
MSADGDTDDTPESEAISPYTLQREEASETRHAFWADTVADRVEERNPEEPIVIKGGISPSGVPHLGNVNEIMRGYYVAEVLRDRGYEVRQVFTADDRDPLRGLPRTLCDLEGNLVDLGEVDAGALGRNLGAPYTDIPDPFGCCDSYGDHFSTIIQNSADAVNVPIELVSNTELYESGDLEDVTRFVLEHQDRAREVLSQYQDKVDEDYVPFNPICEECGKITETVTSVDADAGTVDYRCTDMDAGDQTIDGCGHEGTATLREGKLPWRFEWPAQWQLLGVDFEPFGKDHAEGSWPSGQDVARNVLEIEPPVPMVYEWFTLEGEPFSSSAGNVILVSDVLELLEPEVLRYFFAKDPSKARDFSIER